MTAVLFLLPWLGICGYALWRGGRPEQFVGLIFLAAFPVGFLLNSIGYLWQGLQLGSFGVDLTILILLVLVAFRANRFWPMGIAAMQLLQVMGHLLKLADPRLSPLLYWLSSVVWAYPMLVLLLLGTVRHRNREKRLGREPSWSNSSLPPGSTTMPSRTR